MHTEKRINFKKYILLSLIPTVIALALSRHLKDIFGVLIAYVATVVNHVMLVRAINALTNSQITSPLPVDKSSLVLTFLGKMFILFFGLILSIQLMGTRVIIPLINYIILVFVLAYSLKNCEIKRS